MKTQESKSRNLSEKSDSQNFKISNCKNLFHQCAFCWYKFVQYMIFIPYNNWKMLISQKVYCYSEVPVNRYGLTFFEISHLKEVRYFLLSLQNNSTIPRFQNKALVYYSYSIFLNTILLFFDAPFFSLYIKCF